MDSISSDLSHTKKRIEDQSPLYFRDQAIQEIYNLAVTVNRSGASQGKKIQKLAFDIYKIEMTGKARIAFSEIFTSWPHTTPKDLEIIKEKYNVTRPNLVSIFKISMYLHRIDQSLPSYSPQNFAIIFRLLTDLNNTLRQLVLSGDFGNNNIMSITGFVIAIGKLSWSTELIIKRINRISTASKNLYIKNQRKQRFDDQIDRWESDDEYWGYGGVW